MKKTVIVMTNLFTKKWAEGGGERIDNYHSISWINGNLPLDIFNNKII